MEVNKDIFTVLSRKRQAWVVYGNFEDKFFFLKWFRPLSVAKRPLFLLVIKMVQATSVAKRP